MILRISLILVILTIAWLSLTPTETITIGNDKISHFIAYGILMIHVGLLTFPKTKSFLLGIVLALSYGALIEVGQHFVPGRYMSGYDMLANAGGVFFGCVFTFLFHKPISKLLKATGII